jgi:hypothetical protein
MPKVKWTAVPLPLVWAGLTGGAVATGFGPLPIPVWNQAYQENYQPDTIAEILEGARDAYVLIDPFQPEHGDTMVRVIEQLHSKGNEVGAYISVGTGEDWRDDFDQLKPHLVDRQWDDWGGEFFVDQPNGDVVSLMKARIDGIAAFGFDWVEFDNMDWIYDDQYRAKYGFAATIEDGVAYYRTLCDHVHSLGMKCMAKSTVENAYMFDGVTYESYADALDWWDQAGAESFLAAGKPVIIVHYDDPDCEATYAWYRELYGPKLSFICESRALKKYLHFGAV